MRPGVRQKGKRMKTKLLDGYFIDQRKPDNFDLKKTYLGKRNGVPVECEKTLSHHPSFESASEAFVRLYQGDKTTGEYKSLVEYIDALKQANAEAVNAVQESRMEHFFMYVPKGNGVKEEHSIVDLIPVGRDNAISRKMLVQKCIETGLIRPDVKDKDRVMRDLIGNARRDPDGYTILNLSGGDGYYQLTSQYKPSLLEIQELGKYLKQEKSRIISNSRNLAHPSKLYEDYKHGRINGE